MSWRASDGATGSATPLLEWGAGSDPTEDTRALAEQIKNTPGVSPPPMSAILSVKNFDFIEEHPRSPCCGAEWILEGYVNACSKCLRPVAVVRWEHKGAA